MNAVMEDPAAPLCNDAAAAEGATYDAGADSRAALILVDDAEASGSGRMLTVGAFEYETAEEATICAADTASGAADTAGAVDTIGAADDGATNDAGALEMTGGEDWAAGTKVELTAGVEKVAASAEISSLGTGENMD